MFGLGIRNVSSKVSKILVESIGGLEKFFEVTEVELLEIKDVGQAIAKSVVQFFEEYDNKKLIGRLIEYGLNIKYENTKTNEETFFTNKTVVLTGTLSDYGRKDAQVIIENMGGNVSSSVSNKTDYILAGESPGSKYQKGLDLGITILTEEEFKKIISR